jgi:aminocarboxymuconate-semialdehyde decarboxylase
MSAVQNEQLAALKRAHPDRFFPLASVPLQAPEAAAQELERAVKQLGLSGAGVGTSAGPRQLDEPEMDVFWAKVQELDVPVMFHPTQRLMLPELGRYYLVNFVGNPLDGTIAITRLVFGGVLERFPRLKLVFCHGGGYAPYQWGRYDHGWAARQEPKERIQKAPSTYLRKMYFDTITHSTSALEYLVQEFGADHVVLGTDYPYDMGLERPVEVIQSLERPDAAAKELIAGGNAARLLGVQA